MTDPEHDHQITSEHEGKLRRTEGALLTVWFLFALAYAGTYYHVYLGNTMRYFLQLPEKAPALWRWLDPIF